MLLYTLLCIFISIFNFLIYFVFSNYIQNIYFKFKTKDLNLRTIKNDCLQW